MADSNTITVAALRATLTLDKGSFAGDIAGANTMLGGLSSKMDDLAKRAAMTGAAMSAAFTAPLVKLGSAALKMAIDYQGTMNVLQAVTGATADQMAQMGNKAIQLGADLSLPATSAKDAGEAMLELAKAGLSVNDTMAAAKGTLQLAAAGQLDNARAAEINANALNMFKLSGDQAVRVADLLAASANASSAEVSTMADGLTMGGAAAAAAKIPIEDYVTALAELANKGISGSMAGAGFRTMLLRLENPTKAAAGWLDTMNIKLYDQNGVMKPLPDLIQQFTAASKGMTDQQIQQANAAIFGSRSAMLAVDVLEAGLPAYDAMYQAVTKQGSAADLAAARMKGLGGAIEGLKSQVETFVLQETVPFLGTLEGWVRAISNFIPKLDSLSPKFKALILGFALALAAAGPLLLALSGLVFAFGLLSGPIGVVTLAILALGAALGADTGGIREKIGGLVTDLINFGSTMKDQFSYALPSLKLMGSSLGDIADITRNSLLPAFKDVFSGDFTDAAALFQQAWEGIKNRMGDAASAAKSFVSNLKLSFSGTGADLKDLGGKIATSIANAIKFTEGHKQQITTAVGNFLTDAFTTYTMDLSAAGGKIADGLVGAVHFTAAHKQSVTNGITQLVTDGMAGIKSGDLSNLKQAAPGLGGLVAGGIVAAVTDSNPIGLIVGGIAPLIIQAGMQLAPMLWQWVQAAPKLAPAAFDILVAAIRTYWTQAVMPNLSKIFDQGKEVFYKWILDGTVVAKNLLPTVMTWLSDGAAAVGNAVHLNIAPALKGDIEAADTYAGGEGKQKIIDSFNHLGDGIHTGLVNMSNALLQAPSILAGGIKGAMDAVGSFFSDMESVFETKTPNLDKAAADVLPGLALKIAGGIGQFVLSLAVVVAELPILIGGALLQAIIAVGGFLDRGKASIDEHLNNMISEWITNILQGIGSFIASLISSFVSGCATFASDAIKAIDKLFPGVGKFLVDTLNGLLKNFDPKKLFNQALEIGEQIVFGLEIGVAKLWSKFAATLDGLVNSIPQAVRNLLGMKSPSKVMDDLGQLAMQGLANGLKTGNTKVIDAITSSVNGILDVISKALDVSSKLGDPNTVLANSGQISSFFTVFDTFLTQGVAHLDKSKALFTEARSKLAGFAGDIVDGLGKAVAPLQALGSKDFVAPSKAVLQSFFVAFDDFVSQGVAILSKALGKSAVLSGQIASYATAMGAVADGLGKVVSFMGSLSATTVNFSGLADRVTELSNAAAQMFSIFAPQSTGWDKVQAQVGAYAGVVGQVGDALQKTVGFLGDLAASKVDFAGIAPRVTEIANALRQVMNTVGPMFAQWDDTADKIVGGAADAGGKIADALSKVLSFLGGLANSSVDFSGLADRVTSLGYAMRQMMDTIGPLSVAWNDPSFTGPVTLFSTTAGTVADSLGKGLSFLNNLFASKTDFSGLAGRVTELANAVRQMMDELGPLTAGWTDAAFLGAVTAFATASGTVADGLGKSIGFLNSLAGTKVSFSGLADRVTELANAALQMMNTFGPLSVGWDKFEAQVTAFASTVGAVADALSKTVGLFVSLGADTFKVPSSAAITAFFDGLAALLTDFKAHLDTWKAQIDPDVVTPLANAIGVILDNVSKATSLLATLASDDYKAPGEAAVAAFFDGLGLILNEFAQRATSWSNEATQTTSDLAGFVGGVLDGVGKAVAPLVALATYKAVPEGTIDLFFSDLTAFLSAFAAKAQAWKAQGLDKVADIATAIGTIADGLGKVVSPLLAILGFKTSDQPASAKPTLTLQDGAIVLKGAAQSGMDAFFSALSAFLAAFAARAEQFKAQASKDAQDAATAIGTVMDGVGKAIQPIVSLQDFKGVDTKALDAFFGALGSMLSRLGSLIAGLPAGFTKTAADTASDLASIFGSLKSAMDSASGIKSPSDAVLAALQSLVSYMVGAFASAVSGMQTSWGGAMDTMANAAWEFARQATAAFNSIPYPGGPPGSNPPGGGPPGSGPWNVHDMSVPVSKYNNFAFSGAGGGGGVHNHFYNPVIVNGVQVTDANLHKQLTKTLAHKNIRNRGPEVGS